MTMLVDIISGKDNLMSAHDSIILAIDTSQKACSATLFGSGATLSARSEMLGRGHAERLLTLIKEVMTEADMSFGDLTRLAVITGPGAYTGVRIGVAAARGLALACNIECLGFTALEVAPADDKVPDGIILSTVAGRGQSLFAQRYNKSKSGITVIDEPRSLSLDDIGSLDVDHIIGSGRVQLGLDDELQHDHMPSCAQLALLADSARAEEHPCEPTYFKEADAIAAKAIFEVMD